MQLALSPVFRETWRYFAASVLTGAAYRHLFHSMEAPAGFLAVIPLHGGLRPIRQMASVARDLLPKRGAKN